MKAWFKKYDLIFKRTAQTSRGSLNTRRIWLLFLQQEGVTGIGECSPLPGLSMESPEEVENVLNDICRSPEKFLQQPALVDQIPSVLFCLETAIQDLRSGGSQKMFPTSFSRGESGIPINGLIWMGNLEFMQDQVEEKLQAGYSCIKLKIGALNFQKELELIRSLRKRYSSNELTIRVDANGAFNEQQVKEVLLQLADLDVHSIEQPVSVGNTQLMKEICQDTPIPIALDEELIGINSAAEKEKLLSQLRPQYVVLKPSLHGGMQGCNEWIDLAESMGIGWWITSYLESNVGLNAIAQWAATKRYQGHQGLGTGQLYTNNFDSPLEIRGEHLWLNQQKPFIFPI